MLLTLDNLASRYHLLPSQVIKDADTFDIFVMDLSSKWNKRQQDIARGVNPGADLTVEQMEQILADNKE